MSQHVSIRRRVTTTAQQQGLLGLAKAVLRTAIEVRHHYLFVAQLEGEAATEPPPGVTVRLLRDEEVDDLPDGLPSRVLRELRDRGDLVIVAEVDGRVAGSCWITRNPRDHPYSIPARRREGEVYADGLLVLPGARGRGVGTALVIGRNRHARAAGARAVVSHVQAGNHAALRIQEKLESRIREEVFSAVLVGRVRVAVRRPRSGASERGPASETAEA